MKGVIAHSGGGVKTWVELIKKKVPTLDNNKASLIYVFCKKITVRSQSGTKLNSLAWCNGLIHDQH